MPAGPRLDVSEDYNLFDNQEDVLLVNPDGAKLITTALREEVDTVLYHLACFSKSAIRFCSEGQCLYSRPLGCSLVCWRLQPANLGHQVAAIL